MGEPSKLLEWEYLIYLLPCCLAAFLLLLSSLRLGHSGGHGHAGAHGHVGGPIHAGGHGAHGMHSGGTAHTGMAHGHAAHGGHGHATHAPAHAGKAVGVTHARPAIHARVSKVEVTRDGPNKENVTISTSLALQILGLDRAPWVLLLESFFLIWGVTGFWANQMLLHTGHPALRDMVPSLALALGGGVIGARIAAEVIRRALPPDESLVVSRDGLFGMTGTVAFPVTATAGRIHIYDEFGTLHDEMCRVAPDHPRIEKGHKALVVDMDAQGHLLVEEIPDTVR